MKLKMLREHYTLKGNVWVPKQAFNSKQEVEEKLGFKPDACNIYKCTVCDVLHVSLGSARKYK